MNRQASDETPNLKVVRRDVLKGSMATAGAVATLGATSHGAAAGPMAYFRQRILAYQSATPEALEDYAPTTLTIAEYATVLAMIDRIIPSDDLGPGAAESGVGIYIDQSLGGAYASALDVYQTAVPLIDGAAGDGGFAALDEREQDELLSQVQAGEVADVPANFFTLLLRHTREGYFGDPVHGGNRNFVGWDLVQFPGVKLLWTVEDQALGAVPAPLHISVAEFRGEES